MLLDFLLCFWYVFLSSLQQSPRTLTMGYAIISLCVCVLLVRTFIMVPANTVAIRKTVDTVDGFGPGLHVKWPWHTYVPYTTFTTEVEEGTYYAWTHDRMRVQVELQIVWTQFEGGVLPSLSTILSKQICTKLSKSLLETVLSSTDVLRELESELKSASSQVGYLLLEIRVSPILQEAPIFISPTHDVPVVDNTHTRPHSRPPRPTLVCVPGGFYGRAYCTPRTRPQAYSHLRLVKPADDES